MSLFPRAQGQQDGGMAARLSEARRLAGSNPQAAYQSLMQNNPQFARFIQMNAGKSPEQIARENGIDYGLVRKFLGRR